MSGESFTKLFSSENIIYDPETDLWVVSPVHIDSIFSTSKKSANRNGFSLHRVETLINNNVTPTQLATEPFSHSVPSRKIRHFIGLLPWNSFKNSICNRNKNLEVGWTIDIDQEDIYFARGSAHCLIKSIPYPPDDEDKKILKQEIASALSIRHHNMWTENYT